ncbi:hypothetical protein JHS3_24790 [Jeongeupia sp. HS-3]|uniref:DUF1127 domain-containing protein n=1 Tax=Jeongeupia sp. HS-3 TaxID=1009682 RepID=UPI0018A54D87|nr:DUF1127 domain-containing protein [Jeongeupia sp. HS-3]BCL76743.1 hypothetical protein JHS3_24790 [Jeongeupia sp. HS-3]
MIEDSGVSKMRGLWTWWMARRSLARQLAELRGMSAYQLADLGVAASDIDAIAVGAFEAPVSRRRKHQLEAMGAGAAGKAA